MIDRVKEKYLQLYEVTQKIGAYDPWSDFAEDDRFSFVWKDKSKSVMFSFLSKTTGAYGIACYENEENYMVSRKYAKRDKSEPKRYLQNGFVALWDDREILQKESYETIKNLGFKFRGKGAWLHFERYELGYYPEQLTEKDIDFLLESFKNLFMMLTAIYEQGLNPEFDRRKTLLRWYEPKDDLYYTHPFKIDIPIDIAIHPNVTIQTNPAILNLKKLPQSGYTLELDWSYLSVTMPYNERESIPCLLLGVEKKNGFIMLNEMIPPPSNNVDALLDSIGMISEKYGRPTEIVVCDDDIKNIITDFCKKINVKITKSSKMSSLRKARNQILSMLK